MIAIGGTGYLSWIASCELYDPASGQWTPTGSLNQGRGTPSATTLSDGRILVAGGVGEGAVTLKTAELYDPATGVWTPTGSMINARSGHTATLLPNGKVLVAAGIDFYAELYDPATGSWSPTGSLKETRFSHTATLLPNGKVLVAGGVNSGVSSATAELYNPATGRWSFTGALHTARGFHTATLLPNGKVLVTGGQNPSAIATAELYDPATGLWTLTGSLQEARTSHADTLLPDGQVLVSGGFGLSAWLASAELYDPATGLWTATGSLNQARENHTETLLPDGSVLAAGGQFGGGVNWLASAEIYGASGTLPAHVQGHGAFNNQGNQVTFQFQATQSDEDILGSFSFCDNAAGYCPKTGRVTSLSFDGNSATFSGYVPLRGTAVAFTTTITDGGSSGTPDTVAITLGNGYSASGMVTKGYVTLF